MLHEQSTEFAERRRRALQKWSIGEVELPER